MNVIDDRERGSAGQAQGGGMKKGWEIMSLGELCDVLDHKRKPITKRDREAGEYPYYGATGVLDKVAGYLFDEPLVLVGEDGAKWASGENTAFAVEGKIWVNNHAHVLRPHRSMLLDNWLIYHLNHSDLNEFVSGLTVPKLNQGSLREIPVPVPPLPEQRRIVALLDEAFAGLATAKANAEQNLQNARAIFESHLQAVFSQRGEGWVETTIGETCTLKSGTTVSPALEMPDGDVPYLKVADMSFEGNEDQITSSSRFLMMEDVKESAVIPKGATIFPKRGGAIMTNKKRIAALPICADLNIMSVIPSQRIRAQLLYYYFLNVDMRKLGTGSSIPQINNYDVEPLAISFPESLATQEELIRAFDDLRAETQRLTRLYEYKLAALEELKKSLLHQAFNGEL
jgi:type I restriction enzyme S subunit